MYKIIQDSKEYILREDEIKYSSLLYHIFIDFGTKKLDLTGTRDLESFYHLVKRDSDYNYSYEDINLLDFLDSSGLMDRLLLYLNVRNEPDVEEINKLNTNIKYEVYLRIPYYYVPDYITTHKFIKAWIKINQHNLKFGLFTYESKYNKLTQFYNGVKKGKEYGWNENDDKLYIFNYVDGVKDGKQYKWYLNRKLEYEENYYVR